MKNTTWTYSVHINNEILRNLRMKFSISYVSTYNQNVFI